jgi:Asp-tRNA(Asn)/Glu-tRNA(Gln) amidotransferase A subunit family amidase
VHALRSGGAIVVGKTVTTAFAGGETNETRNPLDVRRTPGGSSSGSAASVGAGMVPAALGSQTQGSTLRPAGYCGAFGFKPTHNALPLQGVHPISWTHDHLGIMPAADDVTVASHIATACGSPGNPGLHGAPRRRRRRASRAGYGDVPRLGKAKSMQSRDRSKRPLPTAQATLSSDARRSRLCSAEDAFYDGGQLSAVTSAHEMRLYQQNPEIPDLRAAPRTGPHARMAERYAQLLAEKHA